ncbi:MAG: DUF4384 domain-containing protein, partial [Deltaproteobacteria bacterium]
MVDGYAYLSENMTLAQTRAAAFTNAKRQALEAAMSHIQSKTVVENFQLEYDLITSAAEGSVIVLEQKDHGVEGNNRYHVWIKAEVLYELRAKKSELTPHIIMAKEAPLTVKVWTDKNEYKVGESVTVFFQGNRDYYARIVDITPSGRIVQLLPNEYRTSDFFEGGKAYRIPGMRDRFHLLVTPPYGEEHIVVYASEAPLGEVSMVSAGKGLRLYQGQQRDLASRSRAIKVVERETGASNSV